MILNATDASNIEDCNEQDIDNDISRGDAPPQTNFRSSRYDSRQTGCSNNPCLNNGQCYPLTPTEYKCSCLPGWAGRNCEIAQEICEQKPCRNQGICRGNHTHYVCDCVLGHIGTNCDQSELNVPKYNIFKSIRIFETTTSPLFNKLLPNKTVSLPWPIINEKIS